MWFSCSLHTGPGLSLKGKKGTHVPPFTAPQDLNLVGASTLGWLSSATAQELVRALARSQGRPLQALWRRPQTGAEPQGWHGGHLIWEAWGQSSACCPRKPRPRAGRAPQASTGTGLAQQWPEDSYQVASLGVHALEPQDLVLSIVHCS